MYPADRIGSSGSMFLKMYMRVFSIMANSSGLSSAHFMSHTSFRSNFITPLFPALEPESSSTNCSSPVTSITDRRLERQECT